MTPLCLPPAEKVLLDKISTRPRYHGDFVLNFNQAAPIQSVDDQAGNFAGRSPVRASKPKPLVFRQVITSHGARSASLEVTLTLVPAMPQGRRAV